MLLEKEDACEGNSCLVANEIDLLWEAIKSFGHVTNEAT